MKKILLLMVLIGAVHTQCSAYVSVEQTTDPATLRNNGFSTEVTEMVNLSKARAHGLEYYTEGERQHAKHNKFVRFWRNLYAYTDPAAEDNSFYHHDTKSAPTYTDL